MTNLRRSGWSTLLLLCLALTACGGGGSSSGGPQPMPTPTPSPPTIGVQQVFSGLTFSSPVAMLQAPGDNSHWFVVEQGGRVRVFDNNPMVTTAQNFIDITSRVVSGGETGLLGMAFHPSFPTDPRVFLFYSFNDVGFGLVSRLSAFTTANAGATLDPNSEQVLLTIRKPPGESNHNGGGIGFGPDGFLYAGIGDGGGGNDMHGAIGNGQLLTTLLGKMLRVDISGGVGAPYRIPATNPFATNTKCGTDGTGSMNCPEIFAWGFRNPWRWSFDRQTGQLWVGDVGQDAREEVDRVDLGGNYGWRCFEGTLNTGLACGSASNLQAPVADYGHAVGSTVTGGYVYRGSTFAALVGRYIFGDFGSGRIWNIATDTAPTMEMTTGFDSGVRMPSFGQGNDGELYVMDYFDGRLFHVTN